MKDVCEKIWDHVSNEVMPYPTTERLLETAERFYQKTQFPHCIGAVDGKHVRCIKPSKSGSLFFNYKDYFSVNLMAVVDAEYRFVFIDVERMERIVIQLFSRTRNSGKQ